MDHPQEGASPAPFPSSDDHHAVTRLEALLAQELSPSGRLAGDLGEGEALDHAERVDVRDRVALAVLDRLEELNGEVRQLRRRLAPRLLDGPSGCLLAQPQLARPLR